MEDQARERGGQEIAECLREAQPHTHAMFRAHHCSPEDSEDILQEAGLALVLRWEQIDEPLPYFLAVVQRQIQQLLRRRYGQREVSVDPRSLERLGGSDCPQARADTRSDVEFLLSVLPGPGGRIVALRYGEGLSSREIAAELSYSEASVRKLAIRNLERLRRHAQAIG